MMWPFLTLLVAFVAIFTAVRALRRRARKPSARPEPPAPLEFDATPDKPVGFGIKTLWLAVRSSDSAAVASSLGLEEVVPCNWSSGYKTIYSYSENQVFVTPPIDGWVLAAGWAMPDPSDPARLPVWRGLMTRLSETFGETQFFANHRVSSYTAWSRYVNGREVRLFARADDPIFDLGELTPEEHDLGLHFFDPDSSEAEEESYWQRTDLKDPEEEDVLALAGRWSVNPGAFEDRDLPPSAGLAGRL